MLVRTNNSLNINDHYSDINAAMKNKDDLRRQIIEKSMKAKTQKIEYMISEQLNAQQANLSEKLEKEKDHLVKISQLNQLNSHYKMDMELKQIQKVIFIRI